MELQLRCVPARLGRRSARARAHAGKPRGVRRRQALDAAQRLARSARADRGDAQRCIRASGQRGSPIEAVVLTGAEIDQTAGLLESARTLAVHADGTAATLAAVADNPMFGVLAADVVTRRAITPGEHFRSAAACRPSCSWCRARCRSISKATIPTPRTRARPMSASRSPTATTRLAYVPGAAAVTPALRERLSRADVILFDGTLFTDDEMIRTGTGDKDRPPHGPHADRRRGRLARRAEGLSARQHFRPHQQHQSDPGRRLAASAAASRPPAGRSPADGMEIVL